MALMAIPEPKWINCKCGKKNHPNDVYAKGGVCTACPRVLLTKDELLAMQPPSAPVRAQGQRQSVPFF